MTKAGKSWLASQYAAGALMLVVAVGIIIAALLLSLVLIGSSWRVHIRRATLEAELRNNLQSGLAYVKASPRLPYETAYALDLFDEGDDSVWLRKKAWGVFDVAVVEAKKGKLRETSIALLGSAFSPYGQVGLYLLTANTHPASLVVAGGQIIGDAYLPQASVRPATEPELPATLTTPLVTGKLLPSPTQLPFDANRALSRLFDLAQLQFASGSATQASIATGTEASNPITSFSAAPRVLYNASPAVLRGITLTGQVVIANAQRLEVEPSAALQDVLLLAPVVVIHKGFQGRLQVIARDTVILEEGCQLAYPSAICAVARSGRPFIRLGERCSVRGTVLAADGSNPAGATVHMSSTSYLEGQLFTTGTLENGGQVSGTVACQRLLYRSPITFYENYLVNAAINRTALSPYFLASPLLNPEARLDVLAWLH